MNWIELTDRFPPEKMPVLVRIPYEEDVEYTVLYKEGNALYDPNDTSWCCRPKEGIYWAYISFP